MGFKVQMFLLFISIQSVVTRVEADNQDFAPLKSLMDGWKNTPSSWINSDPCANDWEGIGCTNSRVTSITLSSMNLAGQLAGDIDSLSELQTLDLSYNKGLTGSLPSSIGNLKKLSNLILVGCSFTGLIPASIGSLQQLVFLSLNSNSFSGPIPPSIGNLSNLYWLDLADNKLSGTIPVSDGITPGLDMLFHTKHFHFGNNQLSGEIPPQLFSSNMVLIHLLLDSNQLTGSIPSSLGLVQTLEVVFLSNNKLTGPLPNLTGMDYLSYVDMSNNLFDASSLPPWVSSFPSLTTLKMERTRLQGQIPVELFSLSGLQTVVLRNNQLNGTLDIGSSHSNQLQLIDLQYNLISGFMQRAENNIEPKTIILLGNPICEETKTTTEKYCTIHQSNISYSTPHNCEPAPCSSDQISSPNCKCAYPYMGTLFFRAPSFSNLGNSSVYVPLQDKLMLSFNSHGLLVDSVSLSNATKNSNDYLLLSLEVFPSGQEHFNRTGISRIGFVLSNQTFKPPPDFGPFYFIAAEYSHFAEVSKQTNKSSIGIIIGAAVGGSVLVLLLLSAGVYALKQKKRAERATKQNDPFASWDSNKHSGGIPQLDKARCFLFEELQKCTNNFSEENAIGSGGYGKVYRGTLPTGQLIAIKRSQEGSRQGGNEFKAEIEMLSRVHHKNVVSLVGFCFDKSEQMLVYEYVPNGSLKESLSGKSGIKLDWMRRLRVALGAARGLAYLHELVNPPIIHRDIKSNNILLDSHLNAKVADFGLSKVMSDADASHISTQVKGTMGYLDPEYYMTQQLTEKSDVYSFGVLILELVTARKPIEKGVYIVREIRQTMDKTKELYNLQGIIDPNFGLGITLKGLEKFVELAMRCVEESRADRPTMSEVVKEIESIMELAGLNPNADSASTSASYEAASKGSGHPYSNESLFSRSDGFTPAKLDPQ
ncbi:leucine-rich repeat receptor protein kinase HPCA1-like isoform X2 [Cornus florida]|uniref:leucine-rich repeat receptor protein kinase HPCA1-like isoform X2 n=1 Tax=Cornus florida TaxID=4283 RepID=UPI002899C12E|nr:leucine-rich repeat receptor protein kinase HPCA1-like isoform X2 [Cornus florida]